MRKYARHIAKVNMKKAGFSRICKGNKWGNKSFFAANWRDYVSTGKKN